ncbi:putative mitochondrial Dna ligase [Leptomonas pyrrhocoris]|uniref:Putative mitochondrial Dna ligase n=1 Tax=Leptomonas pyrrhocoris TaxID=157538 RepID=A0A0N1J5J4_LEPPY|nr:putative mitochondrial Dna ligase [Leptomonas pyrrhocoris]XP_015665334.1 putative mitochondrial Dna ligase [Leptomonas pyrrhocoris]KPA86894.1 putative mitochondrial Dna ligase [Leptomonas pyrrhocoris]KPA86895.1 putative mitochondrial Dna ligase [Leptomonas pyrrhocoris]|eukprot:XP_015665333.1 putative mitochondrial Dna ligase [Leptomonas pyrrhocoris]
MFRRQHLLLAARLPIDSTKLFGAGRERSSHQQRVYTQLKKASIQEAFPHIAACWVGPCWGTVMQTPSNVTPVCLKMAVWRCSRCLQEFEMSIAKFIDEGGICPHCHKPQKKLDNITVQNAKGELVSKKPQYVKAPRMIHSNYRSVLFHNPEWESKNIQPMLAQRWELVADELTKGSSETNGAAVQQQSQQQHLLLASPKIDGIRCMIGFNQKKQEVQYFSRGGILLECCHGLTPQLTPLFAQDPTLMLDGELFAPECNFEQLNGLVRRLSRSSTPAIQEAQARLLEYFAFDIMYSSQLSSVDAPFDERYRLLKKLIPVCGAKRISNYVHDEKKKKVIRAKQRNAATETNGELVKIYHVPAAQVHPSEMEDVLTEACSQGFEGVMIRRPEFPYEHGKRSFGLLKYKQMHDAEFKIVGYLPGEGKFKGGLGAFVCETKDGTKFNAPPKVTYKRRIELWGLRKEYLGKYLTVQYQELSSQDVPRFPVAKTVRGGENKQEWL